MYKTKKTLNERAEKLRSKAAEIERAVIILVENEVGDGYDIHIEGSEDMLSLLLVAGAKNNKKFGDIFQTAAIRISVNKIDELLKENNPFEKKEKPVFYANTFK